MLMLSIEAVESRSWSILPSKYKQTTAQSSVLDVGYFVFHSRLAASTRALAAFERLGEEDTMSTASWLLRTSQTCMISISTNYPDIYIKPNKCMFILYFFLKYNYKETKEICPHKNR
jgi:hypothetical protein